MKKIISLVLCLVCILYVGSFASCTKNDVSKETTIKRTGAITLDKVKESVMAGKIDNVSFALGTNPASIIQQYSTTAVTDASGNIKGGDGTLFDVTDKGKYTRIIQGASQYFYLNNAKPLAVSVIACLGDAFNFKAGNCYSDDVIYALGEPDSKDVPAAEDMIFAFGVPSNASRLTYIFDKYRLDFVFVDDNLLATVLTDTTLYTDMGHSATEATEAATAAAATTAKK